MNEDKEPIKFDIKIPDHMILWNKMQVRSSSHEDNEDILFSVSPKDPSERILISKCPHCNHANRSEMGDHAKFGPIDPLQRKEVSCVHCKGSYAITYEIMAIPYKTEIIKSQGVKI